MEKAGWISLSLAAFAIGIKPLDSPQPDETTLVHPWVNISETYKIPPSDIDVERVRAFVIVGGERMEVPVRDMKGTKIENIWFSVPKSFYKPGMQLYVEVDYIPVD